MHDENKYNNNEKNSKKAKKHDNNTKEKLINYKQDNERLKALISNIEIGFLIEGKNRKITKTNQYFCNIFRISEPSMVIGKKCNELAKKTAKSFKNPQKFVDRINNLLNKKEKVLKERLELKNGKILERDYIPIMLKNKFAGNIWIFRDITSNHLREKNLKENEEKFRNIYQYTTVGIAIVSLNFTIKAANKAYCNMLGYTEEELKNKTIFDITHPETLPKNIELQKKLKNGEISHYRIIKKFIDKNGNTIYGLLNATSIKDIYGNIIYFLGSVQDISDIIELENKIKQNEEKYRKLYENAPIPYQSLDYNGNIKDVNKKWCDETGYTKDEIINTPFINLLSNDSKNIFKKNFKKLFTDQKSDKKIYKIKRKNGEIIYAEYEACVSYTKNNKIINTNCVFVNITEKLKIEKALKEREKKYKRLTEKMNDLILEMDLDLNINYISPSIKKILGYTPEEYKKIPFEKRYPPETIKKISSKYQETIKKFKQGKIDVNNFKLKMTNRLLKKDGKYIWGEVNISPILDKNNKLIALQGITRDVTESINTKNKLKKSKYFAENIIDTANTIIVTLNTDAKILNFNKFAENITGYKKEEVIGKNWFDIFIPENDKKNIPRVFNTALKEIEKVSTYVNPILTKNRKKLQISWSNNTLKDENQNIIGILSIGMDISERINTQKALEKSQKHLKELNSTKDKFFSIIAHDLRNPFNSILGFSELIYEMTSNQKYDNIQNYSKLLNISAKQSLNLLNNLLHWSRIQTGKIKFNPIEVNINSIIQNTLDLLKTNINEKNIQVEQIINAELNIEADKFMLSTILRNLISNAIKYSHFNDKILIKTTKKDTELIISVSDNGLGIPQKNIDKLFKIEHSISTKGTNNEKGTGLGLILCKEFVEKHNGKIWTKSQINKGTTFSFSLPIKQ